MIFDINSFKSKINKNTKLKWFISRLITSRRNPRPLWYIKMFVNPFLHSKGKGSKIRRCSRIDAFPWNKFEIGDLTTIEDFTAINNGAGNVIIGN